MNLFVALFSIPMMLVSVVATAEPVSLKSLDPTTDVLFSQLSKFRATPHDTQGLAATESALETLFGVGVTPTFVQ